LTQIAGRAILECFGVDAARNLHSDTLVERGPLAQLFLVETRAPQRVVWVAMGQVTITRSQQFGGQVAVLREFVCERILK